MYIYIHIYTHIYVSLSLSIYLYIYMYTHTCNVLLYVVCLLFLLCLGSSVDAPKTPGGVLGRSSERPPAARSEVITIIM